MDYIISKTEKTADYELLDSGDGEKLERYGKIITRRPDPQALWNKNLPNSEWKKANARFSRDSKNAKWEFDQNVPPKWKINFAELSFIIRPTSFKHTGLFPEQASNWKWIEQKIHSARRSENNPVSVINLFGYTGGATLVAAKTGANVCHVDGSRVAVSWARENAEASNLENAPIRWIVDDARAFLKREIKRGKRYDGIIIDPPAFGHGADGSLWKIEDDFLPFLSLCKEILSDNPVFFLINGYASGYSAIAYKNDLIEIMPKDKGVFEMGELTIQESNDNGRLLPCGIFARWSAN
jgi:23S rRNA (cytosine1962-C5)-methyltransferase